MIIDNSATQWLSLTIFDVISYLRKVLQQNNYRCLGYCDGNLLRYCYQWLGSKILINALCVTGSWAVTFLRWLRMVTCGVRLTCDGMISVSLRREGAVLASAHQKLWLGGKNNVGRYIIIQSTSMHICTIMTELPTHQWAAQMAVWRSLPLPLPAGRRKVELLAESTNAQYNKIHTKITTIADAGNDLRWRVLPSGIQNHVVRRKLADVSEERVASTFMSKTC
jgi:hypothetical protein